MAARKCTSCRGNLSLSRSLDSPASLLSLSFFRNVSLRMFLRTISWEIFLGTFDLRQWLLCFGAVDLKGKL